MTKLFRRTRGDDGVAILAALGVVSVSTILITVMVGYAISTTRDTARDRQRALAVAGVESVIDEAYAALQVSNPNALTCAWPPTGSISTRSLPDRATAAARIQYVGADGVTLLNTPTTCLPVGYDPSSITGAVITAVGQTGGVTGAGATKRGMESLVKLNPVRKGTLDKAIYGASGVTFTNSSVINGNNGLDADVYSGGPYTCNNSQTVDGNLYVQGTYTANNRCIVRGDAWARDRVHVLSGDGSYGGRVMSSTGDVVIDREAVTVAGNVLAGGTVTWQRCAPNPGKCTSGAQLPLPPQDDFPILKWDAPTQAVWTAADPGFVLQTASELSDCSLTAGGKTNKASKWILDNGPNLAAKTLIVTDCQIFWQQDIAADVKLKNDLAIFSKGGFVTRNQVKFSSTTAGQKRNMYWIVPYDAATRPCTSPPLSTANGFSLTSDVNLLLYSPCNIDFENASTTLGQVYGGSQVTLRNAMTMSFRPLPVFGVTGGSLRSYKVDIIHKRER